jgi:putative hydrolase of the HAD superfamily
MRDPYEINRFDGQVVRPDIPEATIREVTEHRIRRFAESVANYPADTLDALQALKANGMKLALVSNADVMESAGWKDSPAAEYFDETVFSCDAGMMKPEPGIYLYACDLLGVSTSEAVFVGNGGSGELAGAKNTGIAAIS